jgi:hypothetical protein
MGELTPSEKGGIAETAILAQAVRAGVVVSRPVVEGRRYDLIFDVAGRILRVQCKWGRLSGDVVVARTSTCRHTPLNGYRRTTYSAEEIDAIAIYCDELGAVYLLPIEDVAGKSYVHLRLRPARNGQSVGVNWAAKYQLGAVAQLGERLAGSQKVRGSSPLSSTPEQAVHPGGLFASYPAAASSSG